MPHNPAAEPQDESLGELVARASDHISTLVRSEIELAKAELTFNARRAGTAAGLFAAAAFILHLCLIRVTQWIAMTTHVQLDVPIPRTAERCGSERRGPRNRLAHRNSCRPPQRFLGY